MNRRIEHDAVIVGAGPVGAALALALARDGLDVVLVETQPPRPWHRDDAMDLRVVALAPDAAGLLDDLGVWSAVTAARASAYRHMQVWDALAPGQLHFDVADQGRSALGWIIENRLIQHCIWQALDTAGVRVLAPAHLAEIDDSGSAVTATLADGQRLRARLLIAADGAESPLRKRLGISQSQRDYGQRGVVAHVATERPHQSTAWQRFQPGGPLALLPLVDGRCSVVWSLRDAEAARVLALDDAAFCAELGCASDFRLGAIQSTTPRAAFPLRLRLSHRYVAGRCVLIGDAAHTVHPLAGQGMNLGLRDVACLRRAIGDARSRGIDPGDASALRRYERERRSENTLAARGMDGIERVFGSALMPLALARGAALAAVDRIGPLKRLFANAAAGR